MRGQAAGTGRRVLDVTHDGNGRGRFGLANHRAALIAALRAAVPLVTGAYVVRRDAGRRCHRCGRRGGQSDGAVSLTGRSV
ncbi:MAG: hypothetical protein GW886_14700 [Rhodobacterales bacterium]|nr:hypothetical protein [Rhodobacterales bacterium]NCT13626.1 hypothetical protein [Rhodobacterales bacterium]